MAPSVLGALRALTPVVSVTVNAGPTSGSVLVNGASGTTPLVTRRVGPAPVSAAVSVSDAVSVGATVSVKAVVAACVAVASRLVIAAVSVMASDGGSAAATGAGSPACV
jgi:hypothetical protein